MMAAFWKGALRCERKGRLWPLFSCMSLTNDVIYNPSSQSRIEASDTLIALGHGQDLRRLAAVLGGR
jgi:hypothetical protein